MTSISHPVRRRNNKDVSQVLLVAAAADNGDDHVTASSSPLFALRRKRPGRNHPRRQLPSFFTITCPSLLLSMDPRARSNRTWIFVFLGMTTLQALVIVLFVWCWWSPNTSSSSGPIMKLTKKVLQFTSNHFWITPLQPQEARQSTILHGNPPAALLPFNRPLQSPGDNQSLSTNSNMKEPLDDYYSRPHIKVSLNNTTSNHAQEIQEDPHVFQHLSILIIGGSDGSGTRAFVDQLGKLGVPMLADDGGTFDVHASVMMNGQGWPPLVQAILRETNQQAANYSTVSSSSSLTESTRQLALTELEKLKQRLEARALQLRKRGSLRNISMSQHVAYGFKAPVTFLLVPFLVQVFGKVKFLHVLRDGRDVALSENGSPVIKFYNSYYTNTAEMRYAELQQEQWGGGEEHDKMVQNVQAMQLWNDWNVQVHEYCRQRNDGVQLDYLPMSTLHVSFIDKMILFVVSWCAIVLKLFSLCLFIIATQGPKTCWTNPLNLQVSFSWPTL
jgi:hypothetical protein